MAESMVWLLRELGWSQAELAHRLAVSPTTVSRWKRFGGPRSVDLYLGAMLELRLVADHLGELSRMKPRGQRGRHDPLRRALTAEELARRV